MDALSLTPERSRELADLQRRAYGPDADIQRDPNALHRLHELEELAREQPGPSDAAAPAPATETPVPATVPATGTAASAVKVADPTSEPAASSGGDASPPAGDPAASSPPPAARRRWWRRIPIWVIAAVSLVAGVLIGAAVLSFPQSDPPESPDLTLGIAPGGGDRGMGFAQNLDFWGVDRGSVVPYEAFDTIGVWTARGSEESHCILLSYEGQIFTGSCASGGLDPVYDLRVDGDLAVSHDGPLAPGSVIRFMARDGGVDVWVRPAAISLSDFVP